LSSGTRISIFTFGKKSTEYPRPDKVPVAFLTPNPLTSSTVIPCTPAFVSASFTSSNLNGLNYGFDLFSWVAPFAGTFRAGTTPEMIV
jgi:hypothetical protein